jgi:hypothetical protein
MSNPRSFGICTVGHDEIGHQFGRELQPRLAVLGNRDVVETQIAEEPQLDEVPDVRVVVDEEDALVPRGSRGSCVHPGLRSCDGAL